MRKITFLIIIIISYSNFSAISQEIPEHIKEIARTALDFSKNGQYEKALNLFDKLIDYSEQTSNYELTKILKKQKINCYWGISENKVNNDIQQGLLESCTNGLRLSNELDEKYSLNTMMFSVWLAGYYYMNSDYLECNYAIDYTKRLIKECRNKNIEPENVLSEIEGMIDRLETEVNKQINPPLTYSLSIGSLYDAFTSNASETNYTPSNERKTKVISEKSDDIAQVQVTEDGIYKYGTYKSTKYKVVCPNGYYAHIYYNVQKKCWMKTSSVTCDYSSTKGQEGLKKSAKILCNNN